MRRSRSGATAQSIRSDDEQESSVPSSESNSEMQTDELQTSSAEQNSSRRQLCFVLPDTAFAGQSDLLQSLLASTTNPVESASSSGSNRPVGYMQTIAAGTNSKYASELWSVVFRCFVSDAETDRNSVSYFGDSFPMGGLLQSLSPPQTEDSRRRQESARITSAVEANPQSHPPHMTPAKIAYLESENCFRKPPREILDQLIATYFEMVHPLYAIIDPAAFMKTYNEDKCPWILLHAICFATVTYCPMSLICRENGCARREARMVYYFRAKSLFDFSYEKDKIVLLQSAILLSFWGGQPHDYWNTYSWISVAVNVAESLGIHKRSPSIEISAEDKLLWKRIWSCLVTRDSFCAALLGKPLRINLLQCDAEFITLKDLESNSDPFFGRENEGNTIIDRTRVIEHGMYVMAMTRLALILREMIQARVTQTVTLEFLCKMRHDMLEWTRELPVQLQLSAQKQSSPYYIYCAAISLGYNHHLLYMHQMISASTAGNAISPDEEVLKFFSAAVVQEAVSQIADLGSSLVTHSAIALLPQNAYASFFMAIVILYTHMRNLAWSHNARGTTMTLYNAQLKICEMVVFQAQDHWDHADWVLALSENLRQRLDSITSTENTPMEYVKDDVQLAEPAQPYAGIDVAEFPSITSTDADLDRFMKSLHMAGVMPPGNTPAEEVVQEESGEVTRLLEEAMQGIEGGKWQ